MHWRKHAGNYDGAICCLGPLVQLGGADKLDPPMLPITSGLKHAI